MFLARSNHHVGDNILTQSVTDSLRKNIFINVLSVGSAATKLWLMVKEEIHFRQVEGYLYF